MKFIQQQILIGLLLSITFSVINSVHAQALKVATWNLEWLTTHNKHAINTPIRNHRDFQRLAYYLDSLDADIIAFQEVNDIESLQKITANNYDFILSQRSQTKNVKHQFKSINQYTGFAVRKGINFEDTDDVTFQRTQPNKLRFGSSIIIKRFNQPNLYLLSVHLKAGCPTRFISSRASCQTLKQQGLEIKKWVKKRITLQQDFLILGDFNHQLAYKNDWFWLSLSQGLSQTLNLATRHTKAHCLIKSQKNINKTFRFPFLIDHIISNQYLITKKAQQVAYSKNDVLTFQLSDHCPVSTTVK